MTRPFVILSALMLAVVIACTAVIREQHTTHSAVSGAGELLFPQLGAEVANIAALEVHRADGQVALSRTPQGWVNLGLGGYPALSERADTTVAALVALARVAPRTSRSRLHSKLGVEAVAPAAKSTRLVVKRRDGATMADIIVGIAQRAGAGRRRAGVYVRSVGAPTAWLADGSLDIHYGAIDWSDRRLVDIEPAAVLAMTIVHADGDRIALGGRNSLNDELTLLSLPPATPVRNRYQIKYLAGMFEDLEMASARPRSSTEPGVVATASVISQRGLQVTLQQLADDSPNEMPKQLWVILTAQAAAGARLAAADAATLTRLQQKFAGWEFKLSRAVNERLKIRLAEIIGSN